ncbi:MAG: restriction endonuclease subunit S [Gallionellaceae bacterium]
MQVREGYKQSVVEVLPEGWSIRRLGELTTTVASGRSKANAAYGSYSVHGSTGVIGFCDTPEYKGDAILVARVGANAGKLNVVSGEYGVTDNTIIVRLGNDSCLPFFWRQMESKNLNSLVFGSGQPLITATQLKALNVCVPPLPEQRAIATALSDVDALLAAQDKLIAKKRDIKQAAMQHLLTGKQRLPGFSGEWEVKRLGDVADPNKKWSFTGGPFGSNLKSSDYTDDGVRVIQLQNIGDGEFHNESAVFTSPDKADELLSCNIYPGEIILSKMGDPVARACIIPPHHERYLMCSDGIRLAVDPERFNPYFIYVSINAPDFRTRAENAGTGSTRKRIGLTELRNLEFLCPGLPEQIAIGTVLADMDTDIAALEKQRDKSNAIKQGMMQELLTGRIRLV